jgi:Flp pilus assembly pilin Flp
MEVLKMDRGFTVRSKNQVGQSLTEYTIILALVGVAALAGTAYLGGAIKAKISAVAGSVAGARQADIDREERRSEQAFKGASDSASEVSGMSIETNGPGREVIEKESLR